MELFIFGLIIIVLILFSLIHYFHALLILQAGIILITGGLLFGLPAGCYYHYLFFSKKKSNFKAEKWWVSPHKYHKHFSVVDQKLLNRWFSIGAVFFNASIAGAVFIFFYYFPIY